MTTVAPNTDVLEDVAWLQRFARWLAHDASEGRRPGAGDHAARLASTPPATAGVAGWVVVQPEAQPDDATPATPSPTESAEDTPAAGRIFSKLFPTPMPEEIDAARLGDKTRHEQFRDLVRGCMDGLGAGHTGALTVSMHEVGAPDIGTVIDSVEIVHTNFDEAEALQCLVQSMYSFEGQAPQAPFSRTVNRTIPLGKPKKADAKLSQTVGYIVGAHAGEVRFCETESETAIQGIASLTMAFGDNGRVSESSATSTDSVPEPVMACIDAAVKRWAFPRTLRGEHVVHPITLPVPGRPPG